MNNNFKTIYQNISEYIDLLDGKDNLEIEINSSLNLLIRVNESKNRFFSLIDFIFIKNNHSKIYTEFTIRVWNNNLAEVIQCKRINSSEYKNIYTLNNGFETANKTLQLDAHQTLLNYLQT